MKRSDINSIIDEALMEEARNKILEEQDGNSIKLNLEDFKSLDSLSDRIANAENIDNGDETGLLVKIVHITEEELKEINKGIHNDLENMNIDNNYNIDIKAKSMGDHMNAIIKITATNDEVLGSEINESMESEKSFVECLHNAKNENKKNFTHNGRQYDVAECFKQLEEKESVADEQTWVEEDKSECTECGNKMNENKTVKMKKPVTITKEKINNIVKNLVAEAIKKPVTVNGLAVTNRVRKDSKKEEDDYMASLDKKLKKYLSFKGNDNPEFPNSIGTGEKVAYRNTSDEEEYTQENRGGGTQDLQYENEPSKKFVERIKRALEGHTTMGNDQDAANVVKSDTGKKLGKLATKKIENRKKNPMYIKDPQPVTNKQSTVNENIILKEEIQKMKEMYLYNKKTQ